jgi:hypothetical protein
MKSFRTALFGAAIMSMVSSAIAPAYALGGCGPNAHRNQWGQCVFGGQNQQWCLRHTGHTATRMPDGTLRCL